MSDNNISPELKRQYQMVDDYCKGDIKAIPNESGYSEICTADAMIRSLDGQRIQRLLRDVGVDDRTLLAIGLSGEARKWLFSNMSVRLALKIIDSIKSMDAYDVINDRTIKLARDGANKVLRIFVQLSDRGEFSKY